MGLIAPVLPPLKSWLDGKRDRVEKLGLVGREDSHLQCQGISDRPHSKDKALEGEPMPSPPTPTVRYHRDLYTLRNNFVSFQDFMGLAPRPASRTAGFIDRRSAIIASR